MIDSAPQQLLLLVLASTALCCGCALALSLRARERRTLGVVLARHTLSPARRLPGIALVAASAAATYGLASPFALLTLLPLALAIAYLALRPGVHDRVAGSDGVRRGWFVRGLGELEAWRLTGDHLRFRVRGRWEAVPFAADAQVELARRLRATIPERESEFA
jgi:hypothetical protein